MVPSLAASRRAFKPTVSPIAAVQRLVTRGDSVGHIGWITGICALSRIMVVLDIAVVTVAQRTFIERFDADLTTVSWTLTGYTLALAAVMPFTGWATERFGTRRVFLAAIALFTVGSVLCAAAGSISALIAARVVEGLGGGLLLPLKYTIMTRSAGPARLGRLLAVVSTTALLGPIIGPVLGGWLIETAGWEWIFLINVPIGIVALTLAAVFFPADRPGPAGAFDFVGMALFAPGLALTLYGVSAIPDAASPADDRVLYPVLVGLGLLAAFLLRNGAGRAQPLLDLRLFGDRVVLLANAALFAFEAAVVGAALLLPTCLQHLLHLSPLQSGLYLLPQGVGALAAMPVAGYLLDKRGPVGVTLAGVGATAAGLGIVGYGLAHQLAYAPTLLVGLALAGLGAGATTMPLAAAAMRVLPGPLVARGSTLLNVNLQVAASVGAASATVLAGGQAGGAGSGAVCATVLAAAGALAALAGVPVLGLARTGRVGAGAAH